MTTRLRRASLAAALALTSGAAVLLAQPAVHLDTGGKEWVSSRTPIELVVFPPPKPDEGRLAFLIGSMDVTDVFRPTARGFAYRPELVPLPSGERELTVYLVSPAGDWRELARLPLKVLLSSGFETATVTPRLDLTGEGVIAHGDAQQGLSTPNINKSKLNGQLDFQGALTKDAWAIVPRINIVGATLQNEAIRFGQLGNQAPQVDMSAYSIGVTRGRFSLQLGSLFYGSERHLLFSFASRGVQLRVPLGRAMDVSLVAMNGSQIVGWDNATGLQQEEHRILAGTLGVELLPSRPGGLRLESMYLDGSQKPIARFNQGVITDAQKSHGLGFHLLASIPSQRVRLDAGWSTSRFENPADPLLSQGFTLVPVAPESRQAHYADLFLELLQRQTKTGRPMNVSLVLHHSRIDPQYRSVGTFFQADREENGAEANAFLGAVGAHLVYTAAEDNLDRIPSILKTKTRRASGIVTVPLPQLFLRASGPPVWLPTLSYTVDRTHQFGASIPANGEFTASFVPDQVSLSQTGALDWFLGRARAGLRLGRSFQDNRQPGRELADLLVRTYGVTAGANALRGLDVGIDVTREQADNLELRQETKTVRYGVNLTWTLTPAIAAAALVSRTESDQNPRARESELWNADAQIGWRFDRRMGERHGLGGRVFLRYVLQSAENRFFPLDAQPQQPKLRAWKFNAGLSLNVF